MTDTKKLEVESQSTEVMENYMWARWNEDMLQNGGAQPGDVSGARSPTILENFTQRPMTYVLTNLHRGILCNTLCS